MTSKQAKLLGRKPKQRPRPLWWTMVNAFGIPIDVWRIDGATFDGTYYLYQSSHYGLCILPGSEVTTKEPPPLPNEWKPSGRGEQ